MAAFDFDAARYGIERDIDELLAEGWFGVIWLTITFGLPLVSLVALLARRWLALLPLALSIGLALSWVAYYATDWMGPPSGPGMFWLYSLITVTGWVILIPVLARPGPTRPK